MNRIATVLMLLAVTLTAQAQNVDHVVDIPYSDDYFAPYRVGAQSGARAVSGPFDMDGDGNVEFLMSDYTGGGRVHVVENRGPDTWELVYSTPWLDSTSTGSFNARYAYATNASADLDGDGMGEIILPTGRSFSATNPNYAGQLGLYIFEYTGTDDDYGDAPVSVLPLVEYPRIQTGIEATDIDNDGTVELIFANNASSANDYFYIYSVSGDLGSGFEVWVQEFALNPRNGDYGGGSPEGTWVADLNGDGVDEVMLHSWNSYNFLPLLVDGADTYTVTEGSNLQATAGLVDAVAYAGGTVIDINGDGDDEIYLNSYDGSGNNPNEYKLTLINYEVGEDFGRVSEGNVVMGLLEENFTWGLSSGDLDNDGNPEILGVGFGYPGEDAATGVPARFIRSAEWTGGRFGNPEDPDNYEVTWIETYADEFTAGVDRVISDSLGTVTTEYSASGIFAFRIAYLGDADGDGDNEAVIGFQGVPDETTTLTRTWIAAESRWDSVSVTEPSSARAFAAVVSVGAEGIAREERIIVPSDYKLSANYPNPFNPTTTFSFTLPIEKNVSVRVYDIQGRLVKNIVSGQTYPAGTFEVQWDGTNDAGSQVASGTYLYTLEWGNFRQARQMVLVK